MVKVMFKFAKFNTENCVVIDTTSNSGDFKELSPFILEAPPAKRFENLWQFSKVYYPEHVDADCNPNHQWFEWRQRGFADTRAYRYPMGKGRKPLYSMWARQKLGYIEARKAIYATEYATNVQWTDSYKRLVDIEAECYQVGKDLVLLDYDAYDHIGLGMSLVDVINNPTRKMGHAFVLAMLLTGVLEQCIQS
jgi:hypothetical protein